MLISALIFLCFLEKSEQIAFQYPVYEEISKILWQLRGPFVEVSSADDLLRTGYTNAGSTKCSPPIVRLSHSQSLQRDTTRPQVLLSGEIHGDERVGPVAVLTTVKMLDTAAKCVVLAGNTNSKKNRACQEMAQYGIVSADELHWLALLATRRETIVIPTANCFGYILNRRDDNGVDPNRDFGYARSDDLCLASHTARLFNKLLSKTLIQLVITFHGGMQAIGYEWGSVNHLRPSDASPDDIASKTIANVMSKVGGKFNGVGSYPFDRINSLVYPVEGGMEDWMYAAGWDTKQNKLLRNCTRFSNTAVPPNNHAVVFLVETSDRKIPYTKDLGGTNNILSNESPENGHVPRNVRVSLLAIEMVQPYVCITAIAEHSNSYKNASSAKYLRTQGSPQSQFNQLSIDWSIGGALQVNATWLAWHPVRLNEHELNDLRGDYSAFYDSLHAGHGINATLPLNGVTVWGEQRQEGIESTPFSKTFHDMVDATVQPILNGGDNALANKYVLNDCLKPGQYWLIAWATVDRDWGTASQGYPDNEVPKSFLVNARTPHKNSDSDMTVVESSSNSFFPQKTIQTRVHHPSDAVLVEVFEDHSLRVLSVTYHCAWWRRTTVTQDKDTVHQNNSVADTMSTIISISPNTYYWKSRQASNVTPDNLYLMAFLLVLVMVVSYTRSRSSAHRTRDKE